MAKGTVSNYEVMKLMYPQTPATWDTRISLESKDYWDTAKILIASPNFQPLRNEIFNELVNRIAITKVRKMSFNNPLSQFKSGSMPYGDTMQEIASDVIKERKFQGGEVDQFKIFAPDVHAAYHRVNRESVYTVTNQDPRMRRAFIDEFGLQALINEIISLMGGSNEIDEFIYTKKLFNTYYTNTEAPPQPTQIITVPDLTSPSRTKEDIDKFIEVVKKNMRLLVFPNRNYNSAKLMTQTKPSDMTLFLNVDYTVVNEIYNLSSAFNPEYLNLSVPIIGLDKFDDKGEIIGMIVDNDSIEIYDTLRTMTTADNALGLYKNYFYHVQQLYAMSPFKNVIFLKKG